MLHVQKRRHGFCQGMDTVPVWDLKKKKKKASAQSRGPTLGKRMRSRKLEARILQEEPFLAVLYGPSQAQPFLPAKGLRSEMSSGHGAE